MHSQAYNTLIQYVTYTIQKYDKPSRTNREESLHFIRARVGGNIVV